MSTVPTTYMVHARTTGEAAEVVAADATIGIDARWGAEPAGLPGPAELLASAFSACLLKNLERSRAMLSFSYDHADVRVVARRQDAPPKFVEISYELTIATDESARRVELVHRNLQKYGTVYNTLAAVCDVHGEVIAVPVARRGD
ncbi:OsmC family protein [Agromyces sp. ZXT2-6]|uniref:OsmC family protein n=1 Tax=Agromyces sp. ZXT2-6 TaxID=3461153 RepID=UPI004054F923